MRTLRIVVNCGYAQPPFIKIALIFEQPEQQLQVLRFKRRFLRLSELTQGILTTEIANHLLLITCEKKTNKHYYTRNQTRKIASARLSSNH